MTPSESSGADNPVSEPITLTTRSAVIELILDRLGASEAITNLFAAALDDQQAIIARISQRLSALEEAVSVPPKITLPPSTIQYNATPGKLRPVAKSKAFRDRAVAADERRNKAIAERNSRPRKQGKK